jgi:hypothetical protein
MAGITLNGFILGLHYTITPRVGVTSNAQRASAGIESSSSATRTSPRTRHWNQGLDIRVIFEESRETGDIRMGDFLKIS